MHKTVISKCVRIQNKNAVKKPYKNSMAIKTNNLNFMIISKSVFSEVGSGTWWKESTPSLF